VGAEGSSRVLLDLSLEMLRTARRRMAERATPTIAAEYIRGDGIRPPFQGGRFAQVVLLGNSVGFAADQAEALLRSSAGLLAPGAKLLIETVAGAGEMSRYLHRLPPGAVGRLFAAPPRAVLPRVLFEGFTPRGAREGNPKPFRRFGSQELVDLLSGMNLQIVDQLAVAPALGHEPERLVPIRQSDASWRHLLEVEEQLGRLPARIERASALLVAAERRK
jgi:SAM-dependent methyltransferase